MFIFMLESALFPLLTKSVFLVQSFVRAALIASRVRE
jgi:hypothetical protein